MSKGYSGLFEGTMGEHTLLIQELEESGAKFSEKDIVFVTRDSTGQIVWLEKGNLLVGLEHIIARHASQFNDIGIDTENIPIFLNHVVKDGTIISSTVSKRNGRDTITRIYDYKGSYYILTGIGTNGFIVSAYPTRKEDEI